MAAQALTLRIPSPLYRHLQERAERARRSLEAELLAVVATVVEHDDDEELPEDLAQAIRDLEVLDDAALWNAARTRLPDEARARFDALSFKQQSEGLTPEKRAQQEHLLHQSDRTMLVRAHATRLLRERGHDVSPVLDE